MIDVKQRNRFTPFYITSRPGHFIDKDLGANDMNAKISKALGWKMEYKDKPQIYHMTISLAFDLLRIMGRAPFYRDENGRMEYKFCSAIMLYSVIIYLLVGASSIFSLVDLFSKSKKSFNGQVDSALTAFMIAPQLITPILSWIQMRSHQEYLDKWVLFQEKYEQVTLNNFPRVRLSFVKMFVFIFSFVLMVAVILPHYLIEDLRWYHFPGYMFNVVGTLCHFVYWKLTSTMISTISKKFHENFHKEVTTTKGYTAKIEDYRLLWMMLSQLIQNCVTIFWWVILMAYCEAGYKMTESSMQGILHSILEIKNHNILSYEDELHVNIFLHTLKQYSSEATVSDYFVINRSLFGSIITALVTYVIVMIQFHVNNGQSPTTEKPATQNQEKLYDYTVA